MSLYARVASLPLSIDGYELLPLSSETPSGWTRRTTIVRLFGAGEQGQGEDVTWQDPDQEHFLETGREYALPRESELDAFSRALDAFDFFPGRPPQDPTSRLYRRWAFESAALDLALRQSRRSLADTLGREPGPLRFVASLGLGSPPSLEALRELRERVPGLGFKVDFGNDWDKGTVEGLASFGGIDVIDLKGLYRGAFQGPAADPALYARIAETLPETWLEDPEWNPETAEALAPHAERVTWDAALHSLAELQMRPNPMRAVNIKPSRFGRIEELLRVYEYCEARGYRMYAGGQFELGIGRDQIQLLASLFHPDEGNDCAPRSFNLSILPERLEQLPLELRPAATGFRLMES